MNFFEKVKSNEAVITFKRISFDIGALLLVSSLVYWGIPEQYLSHEAKIAFLVIILTKLVELSIAHIYFLISRKLMWKYINFEKEQNWSNNAMIIAMYVMIVWLMARGG